jgi:hypothetical protein
MSFILSDIFLLYGQKKQHVPLIELYFWILHGLKYLDFWFDFDNSAFGKFFMSIEQHLSKNY